MDQPVAEFVEVIGPAWQRNEDPEAEAGCGQTGLQGAV